jgi:hypothetical protein
MKDCVRCGDTKHYHALMVPNDVWAKFNIESGHLCPNCLCDKLSELGICLENGVRIYPDISWAPCGLTSSPEGFVEYGPTNP